MSPTSILADRYELKDKLGSGGMSNVYRATDNILERTVAVKVLAEHLSDDDRFVATDAISPRLGSRPARRRPARS